MLKIVSWFMIGSGTVRAKFREWDKEDAQKFWSLFALYRVVEIDVQGRRKVHNFYWWEEAAWDEYKYLEAVTPYPGKAFYERYAENGWECPKPLPPFLFSQTK